jgi:hypothetical protein
MMVSTDKRIFLFISFIGILLLCTLHLCLRMHVVDLPYFHNEDVAGITYSADLLLQQKLPLVHTVEMKAPGSFFILASYWHLFGRSIQNAQILGVLWSLCTMLNVFWGGYLISRSLKIAWGIALIYTLYSPFLDSIDINYSAWMIMPYLLAFNLSLWAWRRRENLYYSSENPGKNLTKNTTTSSSLTPYRLTPYRNYALWFLSGFILSSAALCKRQAAVLTPVLAFLSFKAGHIPLPSSSYTSQNSNQWIKDSYMPLIMGVLGVLCGFIPIITYYTYYGYGSEFIQHYFFSESGWRYVSGGLSFTEKIIRLWDGIVGVWVHLGAVSIASIMSLVWITSYKKYSLPSLSIMSDVHVSESYLNVSESYPNKALSSKKDWNDSLFTCLLLFGFMSFIGVGLGWRFFKGYYLQLLPFGLYVIAWAMNQIFHTKQITLGSLYSLGMQHKIKALFYLCLTSALLFSISFDRQHLQYAYKSRSRALYPPTKDAYRIGQWIKKATSTNQTIWIWGRWGWPVYFYSQRNSATRYFKSLGVLTTQLSNTWNPQRKTRATRFNPQGPWKEAIKELNTHLPQVIVLARNEPYHHFTDLKKLLRYHYQNVTSRILKPKAKGKTSFKQKGSKKAKKRRHYFTVYHIKSKQSKVSSKKRTSLKTKESKN